MKRNFLMTLALFSCAQLTYADFTFYSSTSNVCKQIIGTWSGIGKGYNWLIGECIYHGTGVIRSIDSSGNFIIEVAVDKDSGSFICPAHSSDQFKGNCTNDSVTITTNYGNLTGTFTEQTGTAQGQLSVSPGLSAKVDIQFKRL